MAEAETHQVGADELGSGQATATLLAELPGPHHELGGDFFRVGVAVSFPFGEDMPDGDQEFTSNGDACPEPVEGMAFSLPMRGVSLSN